MARTLSRLAAITTLACASVLAAAAPALAHVTVNPGQAEQGGYEELTFRVPNERDDAATTQLEVAFPQDHPLTSVSVQPHPGWSYEIEMRTLDTPLGTGDSQVSEVVDRIIWTADGDDAAIDVGEYGEFSVSAGRMPEVDQLVFKALQTYDSGEVVRWIETSSPGGPEPEHPAPVLKLVPAAETETGEESGEEAGGGAGASPAEAATTSDPAGTAWPLWLSVAALVISLASAAAVVVTRKRS